MTSCDVCVVGSGPSGAAIALRLARLGYSVIILEKEIFPRTHVGISMSQGVLHWLDVLGLKEEIAQACFIPACNTRLLWESDVPVVKESTGFHADRRIFDLILQKGAVTAGAQLIQPCAQVQVEENSSGMWHIRSAQFSITARFIVEATGRKSILKGTKMAYLPPLQATYTYCNVTVDSSYIEAGENHWYWAAPIAKNKMVVCLFSDPRHIKKHASLKEYFAEKMKGFSMLRSQLLDAAIGNVSSCAATAYADKQPIGRNYIKVGDAAFSTDPLSAQGVQKALKAAVQGAIAVHTILSGNGYAALDFYREMVTAEVKKNAVWTRQYYNSQNRYNSDFWHRRSGDTSTERKHLTISIRKTDSLIINPRLISKVVPIIAGDYIVEQQGIFVDGTAEPFVFIHNVSVVSLLNTLHNKQLTECLNVIQYWVPNSPPMDVIRWLVYNQLLVKKIEACIP